MLNNHQQQIKSKSLLAIQLENQEKIIHLSNYNQIAHKDVENMIRTVQHKEMKENTIVVLPMVAVLETIDTYCTAFQENKREKMVTSGKA